MEHMTPGPEGPSTRPGRTAPVPAEPVPAVSVPATPVPATPVPASAGQPAPRSGAEPGRGWDDRGMATVEYAIATVAAAGFAGLLLVILRSDEVRGMLLEIIRSALAFG